MTDEDKSREELVAEIRRLRTAVETERAASDELFRRVFTQSSAIKLLIHPADGRIVDANSAAAAFYGWSIEELRRRSITDVNALPEDEIHREMSDASTEKRTHFRFPHRVAGGGIRSVEVFSGPITLHGEELLLSIVHDVTDREAAEEELARSEARLRTLIESLPIGVCVHRAGLLVYVNSTFARTVGVVDPKELVGKAIIDSVHPDDRASVVAGASEVLAGGSVPATSKRLLRRDGRTVDVEIVALRIQFDGQLCNLAVVHDVTEKLALEEQLRRSQRMEAVGRLAGGIAHDFNNLLFVILNSAQFLVRRLGPSPDVDQITAAAQRAADLTRQLLLFSRGIEMKAEVLDLNAVVAEIARLLRGTLGEQVELRTMLTPAPCGVKIARPNVEQVLVNLAVNARDAMPDGGMLTVETSVEDIDAAGARLLVGLSPGRYVRLVIRDTGVGMTPEVAAHAFDPFFTTKEQGRGTGLGLAITYGIVQKAGGHVALDTAPGKGARFTLHLPLVPLLPYAEVQRPSGDQTARSKGETVLLVEDEAAVRTVVERSLCDAGYVVLAAPGPGEALLAAEQHAGEIHLLLTDVVMPRMCGSELAERLLEVRPALHVIYMSGYAGDALARRGVREEDVTLLHKPFTEAELLARVRQILGR